MMEEETEEKIMILVLALMVGVVISPIIFVLSKIVLFLVASGELGKLVLYLIVSMLLQVYFSVVFK